MRSTFREAPIHYVETPLLSYEEALLFQKKWARALHEKKVGHLLMLTEHEAVITQGRSLKEKTLEKELKLDSGKLKNLKIQFEKVDRGGRLTFHNPGQLVVYPIFDLKDERFFQKDLHLFLRFLEEVFREVLDFYGIPSIKATQNKETGIWVDENRKIGSIGLHCKHWIITHGVSININNSLDGYRYIVPCGIERVLMSSVLKEAEERGVRVPEPREFRGKVVDLFNQKLGFEEAFPMPKLPWRKALEIVRNIKI
jgi:lipoate-protein ligase B